MDKRKETMEQIGLLKKVIYFEFALALILCAVAVLARITDFVVMSLEFSSTSLIISFLIRSKQIEYEIEDNNWKKVIYIRLFIVVLIATFFAIVFGYFLKFPF